MNNNTQTVLNRTNEAENQDIGRIRVIETESGIEVKYHITDRERFLSEYSNFAVKTAQSTVEMCRVVFEAKNGLTRSEFLEFLNDIGHKSETSTIRKYIAIGEQYDKLIQYTNLLPNSWTSIYSLTQLSSETFDALASTDTDMSNFSGKEIKSLVELNKPKLTLPCKSSSSCAPINSVPSTQVISTSLVQTSSDEKSEKKKFDNDVEKDNSETKLKSLSIYNNGIDVVSTDDTYEVLVRFKSKPSDDSWWDLTEAIEAVIDERNLNVEMIETRPLFKEMI